MANAITTKQRIGSESSGFVALLVMAWVTTTECTKSATFKDPKKLRFHTKLDPENFVHTRISKPYKLQFLHPFRLLVDVEVCSWLMLNA